MAYSGFFRMDRMQENVAEGRDPIRNDNGDVVGWKKIFTPIRRLARLAEALT